MTNSSGTYSARRARSCSLHLISCRDFHNSPGGGGVMMSVFLARAESAHISPRWRESCLIGLAPSYQTFLCLAAHHAAASRSLIGAVSAGSAGGCGGVPWLHPEWIARGDAGSEEADLPPGRE